MYLPPHKEVVDPVIEQKKLFAHAENILLSILSYTEKHIREFAARRIPNVRLANPSGKVPCSFVVPKINVNAKSYTGLLDWQQKYFQPLILRDVKDQDLLSMVEKKKVVKIFFF